MKKTLLVTLIVFINSAVFAHRQHAHMYFTKQGYELLKLSLKVADIPILRDRIGDITTDYIGDRAWQKRYVTTGAWREDEEDIVYGYSKANAPTITGVVGDVYSIIERFGGLRPDGFVSSTHFLDADLGDNTSTDIHAAVQVIVCGDFTFTVPNAYQKIQKLAYPSRAYVLRYYDGLTNHVSQFDKVGGGSIGIIWYDQIGFEYNSLVDLYKTGTAWIVGYYNSIGQWVNSNSDSRLPCQIVLSQAWRDVFVWEILGRMCHLLQDMSVPAHVHRDAHGEDACLKVDSYENYFGTDYNWDGQKVFSQKGSMINPYVSGNPLHYLMYTTAQMADHFGSNGPYEGDGNDNFSGNPSPEEIDFLTTVNPNSFGGITTMTDPIPTESVFVIRDVMIPQAIRATAGLLYWFAKEAGLITPFTMNVSRVFEFDPTENLTLNSPGGCLSISTPNPYVKNGRQYCFAGWNDGNGDNPRTACSALSLTALYKMVHKSSDASAFSNNSQRKFVRTSTTTPWYHQVYTSMGHVWIEHSTDGVNWTLGNGGLPLDNGAGKLPSIDCNGDAVAVVFQEQYANTWRIVLETFYLNGGSYIAGFHPTGISLGTTAYSSATNPNISWKTSNGTGRCLITWESGEIQYCFAKLTATSFDQGLNNIEMRSGQLPGTDGNSINASLSTVKSDQGQIPAFEIAWQQRLYSSMASVKYGMCAFEFHNPLWEFAWAIPPAQISSSSVMNNYQPSMVCNPNNNWYACWIGDVNGTGDPTSVKVIYTNKSAKSSNVYYMYGMNTMPKSCAINVSNTEVGCYFAWSTSEPSYSNKLVDVGNTGVIKTLNTSGKDIQMCGGAQTGMSVSAFYPFSTPYYFAKSNNLTSFFPKASPNAVATERGCFIGKGDAHLFYSFGNMLVNNVPVDFVDAPDTARYDGLEKINAVLLSQPIQITPTSKFTFTELSTSADSSSLMSVLADTGYVRYRIDLVDNVTGGVIGTVKNTMLTRANPVEESGTTYLLDTKNIGTRTVKAKITISTNLDNPDVALVKSFSETNAVTAASSQSLTLQPVAVVTDYSLEQNFPNPFNPSTQISYSIPKDGMVALKIFDALGREVETLVNEARTVGRYEVTFDGSRLSSGVYFYRLVAGSYVFTRKLMLVK